MRRREFILNTTITTLGASFLGAHDLLAGCAPASMIKGKTRILQLDLVTSSPLKELKEFYTSLLEFPLLSEQNDRFTFQAGETTISFTQVDEAAPTVFYHFAFNIPENKILKAREWQLKRTTLSATPPQLVDEKYPAGIRHFSHWNAHSVFFWDPANNLVEYIARHDLDNSSEGDFSNKDIICASEIAFIADETKRISDEIMSSFDLSQYRQGDENFKAIGDENGLLLVIKKGVTWERHTDAAKSPGSNKTIVTINANKGTSWKPGNYPFEIIVKK
ncbi:MAG: hypothetical protein HOP10_03505 [Chitinophagaceae bacterium]|nr:hypothetical protein [Chitinophagaceae bacterium]